MATKQSKNHHLLVTALGKNQPYAINQVTENISKTGCNILECRVSAFESLWAGHYYIAGRWNEIAKVEAALPKLGKKYDLEIKIKRADFTEKQTKSILANAIPYAIYVVALDEPGTISQITDFFSEQDIQILELTSHTYTARQTKAQMLSLNMVISIPQDVHIAEIRDRFVEFCDGLNFDAIIEPEKY